MTNKKAAIVANLIKECNHDFRLSLRWVLGDPNDSKVCDLPKSDDSFRLFVRTRQNHFLQEDGSLSPNKHEFIIEPMLYAMIDPPRQQEPVPGQSELFQRVAVKPTSGVAKNDIEDVPQADGRIKRQLKQGKGMGVLHLLDEADPNNNRLYAAKIIYNRLHALAQSVGNEPIFASLTQNDRARRQFSKWFADYLVTSGVKPAELRPSIIDLYQSLASMAQTELYFGKSKNSFVKTLIARVPFAEKLGLNELDSVVDVYEFAAMAMQTISAPAATLQMLEEATFTPGQVRKQLKLMALQGGTMIDFWSAPTEPSGDNGDEQRGIQHVAAHLLGLGCDLRIPVATIDEIKTERENNFLEVVLTDTVGRYGLSKTYLFPLDIQNAIDHGASFLPKQPQDAYINFDLTQQDSVYPNNKDRNLTTAEPRFNTGNGLVEIHIIPHPPTEKARNTDGSIAESKAPVRTEAGFNIYGIWAGAEGMDDYFSDPDKVPTLSELKPYLITRRFSLERDLYKAFPDVKGKSHPGVVGALNHPPPQAIVPRPLKSRDYNDIEDSGYGRLNAAPEVPDLLYRNYNGLDPTIFAFDIRRGFKSRVSGPSGTISGWDPAAVTDETWSPSSRRDGTTDLSKPEKYRFFVTSVDAFDQESDPIRVHAADVDADETGSPWIFLPILRTQIPAPINLASEIDNNDPDNLLLRVSWQMPDFSETPGVEALLSALKKELMVSVKFYRRRLIEPVNVESPNSFSPSLADDPNWIRYDNLMTHRGWLKFDEMVISSSINQYELPLAYKDRGFEYIVAVNLSIPEEAKPFWTSVTLRRKLAYVERNDDGTLTARTRRVPEAPTSSNVAGLPLVTLPNLDQPRAPMSVDPQRGGNLAAAIPILPLPGVQRDLVLAKIVGMPFSEGDSLWLDTGISLSRGQQLAAETALQRSLVALRKLPTIPEDLKIDDPRLSIARQIIARSFQQPLETKSSKNVERDIGQNLTIGFRGVMQLNWAYEPHNANPPLGDIEDAEAVAFEVFQVFAPLNSIQAENIAIFTANADATDNCNYNVQFTRPTEPGEIVAFEELVETLENIFIPKLGIFEDDSGMHPAIIEEINVKDNTAFISARPIDGSLGDGAGRLHLFLAKSVATVKTSNLDADETTLQSVLIPVGGGEREIGCWWIAPKSSQGSVGELKRMAVFTRVLAPTIQPLGLSWLDIYSAVDRTTERLNPDDGLSKWLPSDIKNLSDATNNPRLVLRWAIPENSDPDLRLVIERERKRTSQEPIQYLSFNSHDLEQWRIIQRIEQIDETENLTGEEIESLSNGSGAWMMGAKILIDINESAEEKTLIPPEAELLATDGLIKLPDSDGGLPSFIDYWQKIGDKEASMDGNYVYRYRVQVARPVPETDLFLYSAPTPWSEWILPEAPEIQVEGDVIGHEFTSEFFTPRIDFVIESNPSLRSYFRMGFSGNNISEESTLDWKYRILIRRLLNVLSPGTQGSELSEVSRQVGASLDIGAVETGVITDYEVERSFAEESLELEYEVYVQQFVIRNEGGKSVEQLVRSPSEEPQKRFRISIPAPSYSEHNKEIHFKLKVLIR